MIDVSHAQSHLSCTAAASILNHNQRSLRLKAAQQVEQCKLQLDELQPEPHSELQTETYGKSTTFTSISSMPVTAGAVQNALLQGVHVIELYGGLAGGLEMLLRNGIPIQKYYYCDKFRPAQTVASLRMQTLSMKYPELFPAQAWADAFTLPQDVTEIRPSHLKGIDIDNDHQWVLVAGFECSDLSSAGSRTGFGGDKSAPTFHAMLQILGWMQHVQKKLGRPPMYFIENTFNGVATSAAVREAFTVLRACLGKHVILDAARVGSYAHRMRSYWTNIADPVGLQHVLDTYERDPSLSLRDVLDPNRYPQVCNSSRSRPWYPANVPGHELQVFPTLVSRQHSWNFCQIANPDGTVRVGQGLVWENDSLVDLNIEERERIMGYEAGCTEGVSHSARHSLTGATFDATAVATLFATAIAVRLRGTCGHCSSYMSACHSFAAFTELGGEDEEIDSSCPTGFDFKSELTSVFAQGSQLISNVSLAMEADQQEVLLLPLPDLPIFMSASANVKSQSEAEQADVWKDAHTLRYLHNPSADSIMFLPTAERRRVLRRVRFYRWDGSVLHRKLSDGSLRQVPQPDERHAIVKAAHENAGHFGRRRTTALVLMNYWWSGLWQDCRDVVRNCGACAKSKVC